MIYGKVFSSSFHKIYYLATISSLSWNVNFRWLLIHGKVIRHYYRTRVGIFRLPGFSMTGITYLLKVSWECDLMTVYNQLQRGERWAKTRLLWLPHKVLLPTNSDALRKISLLPKKPSELGFLNTLCTWPQKNADTPFIKVSKFRVFFKLYYATVINWNTIAVTPSLKNKRFFMTVKRSKPWKIENYLVADYFSQPLFDDEGFTKKNNCLKKISVKTK